MLVCIFTQPQNLWNPFRDWNKNFFVFSVLKSRHKTSETLLGIETLSAISDFIQSKSHKTSETLLGIETYGLKPSKGKTKATKPLKPF